MGRLPEIFTEPAMKPGSEGNYDVFTSQTVYLRNEGTLQIPLSEDESGSTGAETCLVVKTSAAYGKKIVVWTAMKTGDMPKVPSSAPADPTNEVLDFSASGVSEPKIIPSGNGFQVALSGKYEYWLLKAPSETDGYESVKNPYTQGEEKAYISSGRFMPQT